MDPKSKTKLARMKKYHPSVKMVLIDRHNLGELPGIFATLGVGALLATVGYFAPVPPAEQSRGEAE